MYHCLKNGSFNKKLSFLFLRWYLNQRSKKTEDFKDKMKLLFSKKKKTTKMSMFHFHFATLCL